MPNRNLSALLLALTAFHFGYSNAFQSFQFPNLFKPPSPTTSSRKITSKSALLYLDAARQSSEKLIGFHHDGTNHHLPFYLQPWGYLRKFE
jgi:hypothetical protein